MPKLNTTQIQKKALLVLDSHSNGIRWSELVRAIKNNEPETPNNSIRGATHKLLKSSESITKISKGTYALTKYVNSIDSTVEPSPNDTSISSSQNLHIESQYYQSFADWLIEELEDANHAEPVGGSILKGKWGTPDVIGVLRPKTSDLIKFDTQIISAEIKTDPNSVIVAFGQAVAYRLFSHKSYIVMPASVGKPDMERLEALATLYGIGLVTFDLQPETPNFQLHIRAAVATPDMFYVNEMARKILSHSNPLFNKLFG